MMHELVNLIAIGWLNLIIKITWQGGIMLAIVWLIELLRPKLHPTIKCWLWRLAYLKLIVALFWTVPICLPIQQPLYVSAKVSNSTLNSKTNPIQNLQRLSLHNTITSAGARNRLRTIQFKLSPEVRQYLSMCVFLLWGCGIIWHGVLLLKGWRTQQKIMTGATFLSNPNINDSYQELCQQIGIRRIPRLMIVHADIGSPLLLGVFRPTILLPAKLLGKNSPTDLKLILAHELAHCKRHDLLWNWIPELGKILFFFHPLVWLTRSKLLQNQEISCDYLAIQYVQASPIEYGSLLLKTAANVNPNYYHWQLAFYEAKPKKILKERLLALKNFIKLSRQTFFILGVIIGLVGFLTIIPWTITVRVVANTTEQTIQIMNNNQFMQIRKQRILNTWESEIKHHQDTLASNEYWNPQIKEYLGYLTRTKAKNELIKKCQTDLLNNEAWGIEANAMLGRIHYLLGDYPKAIDFLKKVPSNDPAWGNWATLTLGWCYDALGNRQTALEYYQKIYWQNFFGLVQESIATAARLGREAPHYQLKMVKINPQVSDEKLSTTGWQALTNYKQDLAKYAFDGDPLTQWHTDTPQIPGMYYQLDLGQVRLVDRIILNDDAAGTTIYVSDYPRKYKIEISTDAKKWRTMITEMGNLNYYAGGYFKPTPTRYIKITQLGFRNPENWSIYELEVYTPKQKNL